MILAILPIYINFKKNQGKISKAGPASFVWRGGGAPGIVYFYWDGSTFTLRGWLQDDQFLIDSTASGTYKLISSLVLVIGS